MERRRRKAPLIGLLLGALIGGAGACTTEGYREAAGPVDLRFALAAGEPVTYSADYEQEVLVDMGDHAMEATRRYETRYTITGTGTSGGQHEASVSLDSLRVAVTTAQGRQAFDTRHLIGDEFTIAVREFGGTPEYGGDVPAIDLGPMLGGEVGPTLLIDYAFPRLPDHPVAAGDTWVDTIERTHVEGVLSVAAELRAEYALAGWETVNGVRCARIEARVGGDLSGVGERGGVSLDYAGRLEGTRVWLFDPASGSLVQMEGEDSTEGRMTSESVDAPVRQHTTVRIRAVEST